jgi:hypothetical protein
MKKILLFLCVLSLGFSAVRLQGQAGVAGYGLGAGFGLQVIPLLLEAGLEGAVYEWPEVKSKGTYQNAPYDGSLKLNLTRAGAYAKFSIPGLNLVPVLGLFANPTIHAGTQNGAIGVDGEARLGGVGAPIEGRVPVQGAYASLGFPSYILWLFIEPSIGTQHIYVPGYLNQSLLDAQIALGVSF